MICSKCKSALGHVVKTPYGDFKLMRNMVKAISVLRLKRDVIHFGRCYSKDDYIIAHHKEIPKNILVCIGANLNSADYVATYNLRGKQIDYLEIGIRDRINRLEKENRELKLEIKALKE